MVPKRTVRHVVIQNRQRRRVQERTGSNLLLRIAAVVMLTVTLVVMSSVISSVSAVAGALSYLTRDLPEPETIEAADESFETTKIYDRTGQVLLYEVIDPTGGDRTPVTLAQMPENLICATVALEDRTFWTNPGFNPRGMTRAMLGNLRGEQIQGGSSITQQLIKNIVIEPERRYVSAEGPEWRDYERKISEVVMAYYITQKYSKEQILEWYLNTNFYGNLAYGIEAAAQVYFGKGVGDLTLGEAATLAAIPQFPMMNPFDNPEAARERQALVLDAMVGEGCITAEEANAAKVEPWNLAHITERYGLIAPHFSVYVRKLLETMPEVGPELLYRGGLRVYTTLDLDLQEQAECTLRTQVHRLSGAGDTEIVQEAIDNGCTAAQFMAPLRSGVVGVDQHVSNGAVVATRPATGEILAMVGSLDYWDERIDGQFNVAVDGAGRQPGSSFKPFTYLTLLARGHNAAELFLDVRTAFPQPSGTPYVPENYDRKYHGPQRMRLALARSLNIPAVAALQEAGVDNVLRTAHAMGINTLDRGLDYYGLSLTLGGGEVHLIDMVYAFSVFANGGVMYGTPVSADQRREGFRELDPVAILRVEDSSGRVLYQYDHPENRIIISPQLAYMMNNILSDRRARWAIFGQNNALELENERPAAAKTGTTNNYKDAWTLGYTPQLAVGVWLGNSDNSDMLSTAGLIGAAPVWKAIMEYALQGQPAVPFTRPDGLTERAVCAVSGALPGPHCPTANELFIPGTEPTEVCTLHQAYRVNRETGKLCTVYTPPELCEERVFEVYPPQAAEWIASLPEEQRPPIPPTEYDTIYGPTRADAEVAIIDPAPYSYIRGTTPITGNARGGDFNFYRVVFGEGLNPASWIQIGPDHGNQVDHNILEFWDTSGLDGLYSLRLSVVDHSSALRETTIQVTVDNISPTLELTYPEDGDEYQLGYDEWANVNADVQDYSIGRVEYYVYPGNKTVEPPPDLQPFKVRTVPPFNVNWTIPGNSLGEYTFFAKAVDAAGNISISDRVTIELVPREATPTPSP